MKHSTVSQTKSTRVLHDLFLSGYSTEVGCEAGSPTSIDEECDPVYAVCQTQMHKNESASGVPGSDSLIKH